MRRRTTLACEEVSSAFSLICRLTVRKSSSDAPAKALAFLTDGVHPPREALGLAYARVLHFSMVAIQLLCLRYVRYDLDSTL